MGWMVGIPLRFIDLVLFSQIGQRNHWAHRCVRTTCLRNRSSEAHMVNMSVEHVAATREGYLKSLLSKLLAAMRSKQASS